MEYLFIALITFAVYTFIKLALSFAYGDYAIDLVFKRDDWESANKTYLYFMEDSFFKFVKFWLHPFKWTFNQYFPGLKGKK